MLLLSHHYNSPNKPTVALRRVCKNAEATIDEVSWWITLNADTTAGVFDAFRGRWGLGRSQHPSHYTTVFGTETIAPIVVIIDKAKGGT